MFTSAEKTAIRRHCGYPAYGDGDSGFENWRFFQAYGLMEFRLNNLSSDEEAVTRTYLAQLAKLELALVGASENLDTGQAAVWTHNPDEVKDREALFDSWRRRLCGFLGVPPGPALRDGGLILVV